MRMYGVVLVALATLTVPIPLAAASWEREPFPVQDEDSQSFASANSQGYRPAAWANPYADLPEINIYDDPAPFFSSDDTRFPSDDTDGASASDLDGF
jgi:hypothetical protein